MFACRTHLAAGGDYARVVLFVAGGDDAGIVLRYYSRFGAGSLAALALL